MITWSQEQRSYYIPSINSTWGSRYGFETSHLPFIAAIKKDSIWTPELGKWLLENVGINHKNWEWWYDSNEDSWKFEFKNEEDKVMFILRWL